MSVLNLCRELKTRERRCHFALSTVSGPLGVIKVATPWKVEAVIPPHVESWLYFPALHFPAPNWANLGALKGPSEQATTGLLMRSALPEEIVARSEGEDVKDTVFTVPLLHDCIINMIHDMERDIKLPLKNDADKTLSKMVHGNGFYDF